MRESGLRIVDHTAFIEFRRAATRPGAELLES